MLDIDIHGITFGIKRLFRHILREIGEIFSYI